MKTLTKMLGAFSRKTGSLVHTRKGHVPIPNTILATIYPTGKKTYAATAALKRWDLLKFTSKLAADICTSSDIPFGVALHASDAADSAAVAVLGAFPGTMIGTADAAITLGDRLVCGSSTAGRIKTYPGTTGTWYVIGIAITAASGAGVEFEYAPCLPLKIVV